MSKKYTIEQIQEILKPYGLSIIPETYINVKENATFICENHGKFTAKFKNLQLSKRCPKCSNELTSKRISLNLKEAKLRVNNNKQTLIDETYTSMSKKASFECLINPEHGIWETTPSHVKRGYGCPKCAIINASEKNTKSKEIAFEETKRIGVGFNIYSYTDTTTDLEFNCLNNKEHPNWISTLAQVKKAGGCPKCINERFRHSKRKSEEDFLMEITSHPLELVNNTYIDMTTKAKFRCKANPNHEDWYALPDNIRAGYGCPVCGKSKSKGEMELFEFVKSLGFNASNRNRDLIKPKELDIFIPEKNIAIEYNGIHWHSEKFSVKKHIIKRELCEEKGIRLIQILESEWNYKRSLVESVIKAKLGIFERKIYARKCEIKEISSGVAKAFLVENHLMGNHRSSKKLGLFFQDELISVMSYKKYRSGIDISRFSTRKDTLVVGGMSKLLKYIEKINPIAEFVQYYVDLRYGTTNNIESLGFHVSNISLGFLWSNGRKTFNRTFCRSKMDKRNLSEKEYAKEMKLTKIYDSGQAKCIKNLNI